MQWLSHIGVTIDQPKETQMTEAARHLTSETYGVLRNCDLLRGGAYTEDCGPDAGKTTFFVRCIPWKVGEGWLKLTDAERREIALRVVADCKEKGFGEGVIVSNNPEFGGDYVRVEKGSRAYNLICHLKS